MIKHIGIIQTLLYPVNRNHFTFGWIFLARNFLNPLRIFILTSLLGHFFYWRIFLRPMAIFFYGAYRGGMLAAMEPDRKLQKLFSTPPPRHYTIPCQSLSIPCAKIYCLTWPELCACLTWLCFCGMGWQVSYRCLTCVL